MHWLWLSNTVNCKKVSQTPNVGKQRISIFHHIVIQSNSMPKPRRDRLVSYHMFIQKQHIRLVSLNHLYQLQLSFHIAYPPDVPENAFHVGVTLLELFLCLVGMLGSKLPTVCFLFLLTGFLSGFFLSIDATIKARYLAPFGVCLDKDNWLSVSVSGSIMPSIWGWRARLWTSEAWNFLLSGRNSSSTFVIRALKVTWDKILSLDLMVETTWSTTLLFETETALRIPTPQENCPSKERMESSWWWVSSQYQAPIIALLSQSCQVVRTFSSIH